jgi:hypothetical protein
MEIRHIMNANVERDPDKPSPEEIADFAERSKDPKFWEAIALLSKYVKWDYFDRAEKK